MATDKLNVPEVIVSDGNNRNFDAVSLMSYDVPDEAIELNDVEDKKEKIHTTTQKWKSVVLRAAKAGNLQALKDQIGDSFLDIDENGETLIHMAIKKHQFLEQVLVLLKDKGQLDNIINIGDNDGNTALHLAISAEVKNESFALLCKYGGNLSAKNNHGDTILHTLLAASVINPQNIETFMEKYDTIVEYSIQWWTRKEKLIMPRPGSASYNDLKRYSLLYLTNDVRNNENMNVIQFAIQLGAHKLFRAIYSTNNVYRFEQTSGIYKSTVITYDVTGLVPETVAEAGCDDDIFKHNAVKPLQDDSINEKHGERQDRRNGLDIIATMDNFYAALRILEVPPFQQLVENFWRPYRVVFFLLAIPHVVYMTWYSYHHLTVTAGTPQNNPLLNCSGTTTDRALSYVGVLSWPLCLLLFEIYYIGADRIYAWKTRSRKRIIREGVMIEPKSPIEFSFDKIGFLLEQAGYYVFENLPHIGALCLPLFVSIEYVGYIFCGNYRLSYIILALIYGWLCVTSYPRGYEGLHGFSVLYKYIIIHNFPRIISVLAFFICSYVFSFHLLISLSGVQIDEYDTLFETFFSTFSLMLSHDYSWGQLIVEKLEPYGIGSFFLNTLFFSYIIITAIVFLNILIAMMTDTYSKTSNESETEWKIDSLVRAVRRERKIPLLRKALWRFKKTSCKLEFKTFKIKAIKLNKSEAQIPEKVRCMIETTY